MVTAAVLLAQPGLRRALTRRARELVEARYTWECAAQQLEDIYALAQSGHAKPNATVGAM